MEWEQGGPRRSSAAALLFAFSVGVPSAAKAEHYAGTAGTIVYLVVLGAVVLAARRVNACAIADLITSRRASALLVVMLVALALAFVVVHPRVTGGSDRDEALDLAARELSRGRFPYYRRVFPTGVVPVPGGGNAISPMPGELLFALPFVLLGSGAWQTFFWLAAFFCVSGAMLRNRGRALLALGSMLILGPVALQEIMTGGDLLANSLWVLVLGALVVGAPGGWAATASALLFGVGLSSRAHFLLVLPVLFVVLAQRRGRQEAAARCALAVGGFVAVTLPFYLYDPAGFSPLHVATKLRALDLEIPHTVTAASVVGSVVAAAVLARQGASSDVSLLATSAVVLGVPVVVAVVLACRRAGATGFAEYGWYAVSSMPFGVLAAFAVGLPRGSGSG